MQHYCTKFVNCTASKILSTSTTICIDCRYLHDRPSGIAECVRALVDNLPTLASELRFLFLKNPRFPGRLSDAPNVQEITVKAAANGPATAWWLPRIVDLSGIDLYHSPANILPRGLDIPSVTTVHDIMWLNQPHWCNSHVAGIVDRLFYSSGLRHALRRSTAIATVSEASKAEIVGHDLAPADRVHVTRNGVATQFRPTSKGPSTLQHLGLGPDARYILTVGQNAPYKNHPVAIHAFHQAFADRPDIHMILIQRRQSANTLRPLITKLGLTDRVHTPGTIDAEELVALYGSAQALLHPSLCEGFGNPLVEAMACGCPVITSDRSAMPEVTGGAALLVDPEDCGSIATALRSIVNQPDKAAAMKAAGLERAKAFDWREFANANLAIYRNVLEG